MNDIVDDIMKPEDAPKRIYGWLNSHLSIARHYGGCTINGVEYRVRADIEGQPLEEVRKPARKRKAKR